MPSTRFNVGDPVRRVDTVNVGEIYQVWGDRSADVLWNVEAGSKLHRALERVDQRDLVLVEPQPEPPAVVDNLGVKAVRQLIAKNESLLLDHREALTRHEAQATSTRDAIADTEVLLEALKSIVDGPGFRRYTVLAADDVERTYLAHSKQDAVDAFVKIHKGLGILRVTEAGA